MTNRNQVEDRGVAPVVGISLLIAITVILAGVIASVVFGIAGETSDPPEVTLSFSVEGTTVELNHEGGETLDADEVVIKYDGTVDELDSDLVAGQSQEILAGTDPDTVDRVSVVWQDPTSDTEKILATFKP